jgi:hypothetical protein
MKKALFLEIAAVALVLAGCGDVGPGNNDDALSELAGKWHNNLYEYAFEITEEGDGYVAKSRTHCTVSVSGPFVYFRDTHDNSIGSFHYSIKNGELTMTLGIGDFRDMSSLSPFIQSGNAPSGGVVPVEFIGKWYAKSASQEAPSFEITKYGLMTISGSPTQYTAFIPKNTNTIAVLEGSVLKGEFRYFFSYGEMSVTRGTDICSGLVYLSPFVKKNN